MNIAYIDNQNLYMSTRNCNKHRLFLDDDFIKAKIARRKIKGTVA